MPPIQAAYLEHQLKRGMRPDAHLFVRPDWRKFGRPELQAGHPFALYENKYRPDQARDDHGRWVDEGGGDSTSDVNAEGEMAPSADVNEILEMAKNCR